MTRLCKREDKNKEVISHIIEENITAKLKSVPEVLVKENCVEEAEINEDKKEFVFGYILIQVTYQCTSNLNLCCSNSASYSDKHYSKNLVDWL